MIDRIVCVMLAICAAILFCFVSEDELEVPEE